MSQLPPIYRDEQPFPKPQPLGGPVYTGQPSYRPPPASNPGVIIAKVLGVLFLMMILVVGLIGFAGYMVFSVVRDKAREAQQMNVRAQQEMQQQMAEQMRQIEADMAAQQRKTAEERARILAERPPPAVTPSTTSSRNVPAPANPAPGQFSSDVQRAFDEMKARMETDPNGTKKILDDLRAKAQQRRAPGDKPAASSDRNPATPSFPNPPPIPVPTRSADVQQAFDEMNARMEASRARSQKIIDDMHADSERRREESRKRQQEMRDRFNRNYPALPPLPR